MSHTHLTERYVRQLPLLTDDQALSETDNHTRQALLEQIVGSPLDDVTTGRSRRVRRRAVVLVATLGLLSLAAVGWAVITLFGSTTMAACHTEGDPRSGTGIELVTGDPVADCSAVWERSTGQPPPDLTAYENTTGGIAVLPADVEAPDGWQPLATGTAQDPRVIELRVALDDRIAGLPSACMDAEAGRALAERELERLSLSGWSVSTERGDADGADYCIYFRLEPDQPRVILYPREGLVAPDDSPPAVYARELERAVDQECLDLDQTARLVRRIAGDVGIQDEGLVINDTVDATATCTRVHLTVGGRFEVHLRGPQATG